jgi:hypothetical protein
MIIVVRLDDHQHLARWRGTHRYTLRGLRNTEVCTEPSHQQSG